MDFSVVFHFFRFDSNILFFACCFCVLTIKIKRICFVFNVKRPHTKVGVCGKDKKLANELDMLIFETIELATLNHRLRQYKQDDIAANRMITDALFVSITNADFDVESVKNKIKLIKPS